MMGMYIKEHWQKLPKMSDEKECILILILKEGIDIHMGFLHFNFWLKSFYCEMCEYLIIICGKKKEQ